MYLKDNMKKVYYIAFIFLPLIISCKQSVSINEYISGIEKNKKFSCTYNDDEFYMECRYRPGLYMAIEELAKRVSHVDTLPKEMIINEVNHFRQGTYFSIKLGLVSDENILLKNITGMQQYANRINYLNENLVNDFVAFTGKDTLKPVSCQFYNSYGMSNHVRISLVFPGSLVKAKNFTIQYTDKVFGLENSVKLKFNIRYNPSKELKKLQVK